MPDLATLRQEIGNNNGIHANRAAVAFKFAQEAQGYENYDSYVKKMPAYIKTNGLGQTLAFYLSKAKREDTYKLLLDHLRIYFQFMELVPQNINLSGFVDAVINMDAADYRYATTETLAMIDWLRRFAGNV